MFKKKFSPRPLIAAGAALALMAGSAALLPAAAPVGDPLARLEALETEAQSLQITVDRLGVQLGTPPAPRLHLAQNREIAQVTVRLDNLEEQMRMLTGQIEAMQFQLQQLQANLERMQSDYELRFQDLEGGALGEIEAVPEAGATTPTAAVPPATPQNQERLPETPLPPATAANDSLDPLIANPDDPIADILGSLPADLFDQPLTAPLAGDALPPPSDRVSDADAEAQYAAGVDALQRNDLAFAADQFRQFIALYPNHRLAPDATTLLGETLLQQQQFDEAAQVLVAGFEDFPTSARAPEMLLGIGTALAGAGERETACRTYVEVLRRYPAAPADFLARVNREQRAAQC